LKKYMIFALSFILLFVSFQFFGGMFLTYMYTPDINAAWQMGGNLDQETAIKGSHSPFSTLVLVLLAASLAYFISNKFSATDNAHK